MFGRCMCCHNLVWWWPGPGPGSGPLLFRPPCAGPIVWQPTGPRHFIHDHHVSPLRLLFECWGSGGVRSLGPLCRYTPHYTSPVLNTSAVLLWGAAKECAAFFSELPNYDAQRMWGERCCTVEVLPDCAHHTWALNKRNQVNMLTNDLQISG